MTKHQPGRKAGPAWDGTGTHQPHVRVSIMLTADHHVWLNSQPGKRSKIIRKLIQQAIDERKQKISNIVKKSLSAPTFYTCSACGIKLEEGRCANWGCAQFGSCQNPAID